MCGWCQEAKAWLDDRHWPYTVSNVGVDPAARQRAIDLSGQTLVPVIEVDGHVLGDFDNEESKTIEKVIAEVDKAIVTLIQDGLETAMNRFNRTNSPRVKKSAGATPPPAAPPSET